jgi:large subunit ribosomal protein L29
MPNARELREMDDDLLLETVREARRELFGLRFRHATGELDLARALTVTRERGLDVQPQLTASE